MIRRETDHDLECLLDHLKEARHFDFTGYKRASLKRRIDRRLQDAGISSYSDYVDYLEVHPDEFVALFNTVLINVTTFFRDASAWEYIRTEVIPAMARRKGEHHPYRIWSAGCASGEEAYTLAIVFAEALGADALREQVKIYATDIDEVALARARHATYSAKELSSLPEGALERYFERTDGNFTFRKDLRRSVIFGRHDLIQDAPISRVDLLSCRNCLMYMNSETQSHILQKFQFALDPAGCLFLGRAEMLFSHSSIFTAVDLKHRLFCKTGKTPAQGVIASGAAERRDSADPPASERTLMREAAFNGGPVAMVVIDAEGRAVSITERARAMLGLSLHDVGRPLQDLEMSYRPVELRSYLEQAQAEQRTVTVKDVLWPAKTGEARWLDVIVSPLQDGVGKLIGATISLSDVTMFKHLQEELERANQELETAYEELQSTNEELETTNEELQSTVEELETTNEELQSTNEELETINEEMESSNEELHAVNDELRRRGDELNHMNAFQEAILTSLRGGVVVVDMDSRVQIWNRRSEDLWGLRREEVQGRNLLMLDFGLPVENLKRPLRACLTGAVETENILLRATNRRGRTILCRVTCVPLVGVSTDVQGAILVMDEVSGEVAESSPQTKPE